MQRFGSALLGKLVWLNLYALYAARRWAHNNKEKFIFFITKMDYIYIA